MDKLLIPTIFGSGVTPFYPTSIPYSARFDSARSCKLSRTPAGSGTSARIMTIHAMVKPCVDTAYIFESYSDVNNRFQFYLDAGSFNILDRLSSTNRAYYTTAALFRDPANWLHVTLTIDTTQATAADRVKLWVNGAAVTLTATTTVAQNTDMLFSNTYAKNIGTASGTYSNFYMAQFIRIDGTALTPTSFGQFSTQNPNVWVPKALSGLTYGTQGELLAFGNAAALGTDTSGNGNNYTSSGLASTDQMQDTPTNNFCTLNPVCLSPTSPPALTEGNLKSVTTTSNTGPARGSFGVSSGKWYWEGKIVSGTVTMQLGIVKDAASLTAFIGSDAYGYSYGADGYKWVAGTPTAAFGATYTTNDIIGVALDMDAGTIAFYKNNVLQGTLATGLSGTVFPAVSDGNASTSTGFMMNFGANAFAYTPPTGFKSLCTANLPDPAQIDSTKGFDAKTWVGANTTSASRSITSFNFQPDFVWTKNRTDVSNNVLWDSIRGVGTSGAGNGKELSSNSTNNEGQTAADTYGYLSAFLSNGFTMTKGTGDNLYFDKLNSNYVAWCWKKAAEFGMDIVGYTGTGATRTIAHSLGATPEFMIFKSRDSNSMGWLVYHKLLGYAWPLFLNTTAAKVNDTTYLNAEPTSSVFNLGVAGTTNLNGQNFIAYLFRSVPGFSSVFSYTANGNADGPFVHLGFRPRFVLLKNASYAATDWQLFDAARGVVNVNGKWVAANTTAIESDMATKGLDFLSNGIKVRGTDGYYNRVGSTDTIIGIAFAEAPFKYANAR